MKLNNNKKSVKISRSLFLLYAVLVCGIVFALPAFAADDPLVVVENLSTFIFSLIRAVGLILLGCEVLYYSARPGECRCDFSSVVLCLLMMGGCFGVSTLMRLAQMLGRGYTIHL